MKLLSAVLICGVLAFATNVDAQSGGKVSFENPEKANKWEPNPEYDTVLQKIRNEIGDSATKNIQDAEQVFCYEVTTKPNDYDGYTMNNMAVSGFCGVINPELRKMMTSELFMNPNNVLFDVTDDCIIKPRIMFRFVRGIDNTDVLLSSPCHSFAIFYGGSVKAFNARPAANIINALITPLMKNKVDFASPALFNQLLPIGIAQTQAQKDLLKKKNEPIRNWEKKQIEDKAEKKRNGWNNLNLKL